MTEYDKDAIVNPSVSEFIRRELDSESPDLANLREYANSNRVPILLPEAAAFLKVITQMHRPENVLEIGTAIGYSALLMAKNGAKHITTLELDPQMVSIARRNTEAYRYAIRVVEADARDYLPYMDEDETLDMIFLDGPKGHYINMLEESYRLLKKGGILLADNILYKGMTFDDDYIQKRKTTIVKRLRAFIDTICNDGKWHASILTIGDGFVLAVKK